MLIYAISSNYKIKHLFYNKKAQIEVCYNRVKEFIKSEGSSCVWM